MERYKLGISKIPAGSNNFLWNKRNSCFLGKEELLNAGNHEAFEMHV